MIMVCFLTGMIVAGIDLGIKQYVEKYVKKEEERSIWKKRGILRKVHNRGMMMNKLEQHPLLVQLASVFAGGVLLICQALLLKKPGREKEKLGITLMIAGAISNTYDRLRRGYVVDYLAVKTRHKRITDITFNLADVSIFVGAVVSLWGAFTAAGKGGK